MESPNGRKMARRYTQGVALGELRGEHLQPLRTALQERTSADGSIEELVRILQTAPRSGELLANEAERIRHALAGPAASEVQLTLQEHAGRPGVADALAGLREFLRAPKERARLDKLLTQGGLPMHKLTEQAWQQLLGAARKVKLNGGVLFDAHDRVSFVWVLTDGTARSTGGQTFFPGHVIGAEMAVRGVPAAEGVLIDPRRDGQPVVAYMIPAQVYLRSVLPCAHYDFSEFAAASSPD